MSHLGPPPPCVRGHTRSPHFTGKHEYEGEEKDFEQAFFFSVIDPSEY